jgi:hypothetical protein
MVVMEPQQHTNTRDNTPVEAQDPVAAEHSSKVLERSLGPLRGFAVACLGLRDQMGRRRVKVVVVVVVTPGEIGALLSVERACLVSWASVSHISREAPF